MSGNETYIIQTINILEYDTNLWLHIICYQFDIPNNAFMVNYESLQLKYINGQNNWNADISFLLTKD